MKHFGMKNFGRFLNVWRVICFILSFVLLSSPAFSGELIYSMSAQLGDSGETAVHLNISSASQLALDSAADVILPGGQTVSGVVKRTLTGVGRSHDSLPQETSRTIVSFENNGGALELL